MTNYKKIRILWVDAVDFYIEVESRYQPLGIFYMIAQLRQRFQPDILEFRIVNRDIDKELASFKPHITAISSVSQNYNLAKKYAQLAKAHGSYVVVGGVHISAIPNSMIESMDIGVIGEGEITFGDVVDLYLETGALDTKYLSRIPGLVYWGDGQLQYSEPRTPVPQLDSLAHPDRSMMNSATKLNILSSRGCPFNCTFCFSARYWGKTRYSSPDYIIEEIDRVLWTGAQIVSFWDDLFASSVRRLQAIYDALETNKLLGKFRFTCTARSNLLKEPTVKLLKEMGCVSVGMGLESGNEEILQYLKGKNISISDHESAISLLRQYGIEVSGAFIIGSPHETKAQIMDTYNFIRRNAVDIFDVYLLTPLPGTPIWEYAQERGLVHDDMDWNRLNFRFSDHFEDAVILSECLSHRELVALYKKFKRLRRMYLAKNIWKSPHLFKVPIIFWGQVKEKTNKLIYPLTK